MVNPDPRMQWFILTILAVCLLGSVVYSITALIITQSIIPFAIPGTLLLAMRPIIRYLFPQVTRKGARAVPQKAVPSVRENRRQMNGGVIKHGSRVGGHP